MNRVLLILLTTFVLFSACDKTPEEEGSCPSYDEWVNYAFGNPTKAEANADSLDNYLVILPEYTVSYNSSRGIPNWVSWHLDDEWQGTTERNDNFIPYPNLPAGFFQPTTSDYTSSGFDRGHNLPSADRTCSPESNDATFYMINIVPQSPNHNRGLWKDMESFARGLTENGFEVYNIVGNYGVGGTGSKGYHETYNDITVPSNIWKVMLILPKGKDDFDRVDEDTRIIAVDIPNVNDFGNDEWHDYITTVDMIEANGNVDVLNLLSLELQATLEQKVDIGPW